MKRASTFYSLALLVTAILSLPALGQITPSDDAYTLTSSPTKNFGTANTLEVESSRSDHLHPLRSIRNSFLRHRLNGRQGDAQDLCRNRYHSRLLQHRSRHEFLGREDNHCQQ